MSEKLRPLADNVLIKRFKNDSITSGGIHVPEVAQAKTQTGLVVAVGEGKLRNDGSLSVPKVAAGDVVVFGKYSGTDVELDGEEFLMLKEGDLLGIVEKDSDVRQAQV